MLGYYATAHAVCACVAEGAQLADLPQTKGAPPPHVIRLGAKGILALYNCVRPSTISTMRSAHGGGKTAEKSVPVAVCVRRFPLADRLTTGRRRFQFA